MTFKLFSREHFRKLRSERGYTLIETLLVIAIMAFAIAAVVALYLTITSGNAVNQATQQVQAISSNIQKAYNTSGSPYSSLTTQAGINIGVFPDGMVRGTTVYNSWNGTVSLQGSATNFTITYTNVAQAACASLASTSASLGSSLTQVTVNGSSISIPVDPALAGSACSQSSNTIAWTLR